MIVGIDVHKHSHAAALLDERGGEVGTLTFTNTPKGYQRLIAWLADHDAADAVIGVESPGAYGPRSSRPDTTRKRVPTSPARPPKARPRGRHVER